MHARTYLAGLGAAAAALSVVAMTAAPAHAAYTADPDDTAIVPGVVADLVGVGSDTTQGVVKALGNAYNTQPSPPASKIVSYAATGGGTLDLPDGACGGAVSINRPVGSGAGKNLLHGATNNCNVDFARSSSTLSGPEISDSLQQFPFAVDTLIMVKSGNVASHAPANLTIAQIVNIYKCSPGATNWSDFGGSAGVIKPKAPQSGSGTLSFFQAQLQAANGGTAVTFGPCVDNSVVEHDPNPIKDDPDAIAPFSLAKKSTLANPAVVTTEPGFQADRAVYNVVRGADVAKAEVLAAFGTNGYFCSAAGKTIIEAQGFKQLFPPSKGGVCGQATQNPAANLITANVTTTTSVTVASASASSAKITATVTGSSAPSGTVTFSEVGGAQLAANVPLISGQATFTATAAPGSHTYKAVFTPAANTPFTSSEGQGTGTVQKATSSIKGEFPKKVAFGKKAKGMVTVTLTGTSSKASGTVTVKDGSKTVGTGTLSNGVVTITLKKLKPGKHTLTIEWAGDANASGSSTTVKIKGLPKPKKK